MTKEEIAQARLNATAMMCQYLDIKEKYLDSLVLYRLGDFYELFYSDAKIVSEELGLVLTSRQGVPMCGIPWHSYEMHITKLIQNGHRIAICEQTETPEEAKEKGNFKAPLERKVVRVVTQGTLVESSLIKDNLNNFLLAISDKRKEMIAMSCIDISTMAFFTEEIELRNLTASIYKVNPVEIICSDKLLCEYEMLIMLGPFKSIIHTVPESILTDDFINKLLVKTYGPQVLAQENQLTKCIKEAVALTIYYLSNAYVDLDINLPFPKVVKNIDYVQIDSFAMRSLEIIKSQSGKKRNTLLGVLNRTVTSFGIRLLNRWLVAPLLDIQKINKRLDFVESFYNDPKLLKKIRDKLENFPDIERALSRITISKAGPRDLNIIKIGLKQAINLWSLIKDYEFLSVLNFMFNGIESISEVLERAMLDEVPYLARDGNFIKVGYNANLDELRSLINDTETIIDSLQKRYIAETKINTLKIKKNNILGFFIEVSPSNAAKVSYDFIHKQTLASAVRYTTSELMNMANKIYSAEANALQTEVILFEELLTRIRSIQNNISALAQKISFLDVISSLAFLAIEENYVRPTVNDSKTIRIKDGAHPIVKMNLRKDGKNFVENDFDCSEDSIISVLMGPNMGGKSTFLRQNAIIIIMAQIGSFVPASLAEIGLVDKIFSRVGAFDDISNNLSTFMVEMVETAAILANATERSFVILDELGRGTSTYDGLSIAMAVSEEIHNNLKARTIFATHYHEMVELKENLKNVLFLRVNVREEKNQVVFLHKITPGFIDKSYGIHVAALAGIPQRVIQRANQILKVRTAGRKGGFAQEQKLLS
jgi:DNA mismatch repair protein MutS